MKRTTITDVASWAGVSIATVSHYLNGTKRVSSEIAERIDAAIKELNYIPNANARSLKSKQTYTIGLVIPDIVMYSSICYYIESQLYENGYNVIICNTNFDHIRENKYLNSLLERRVDGLILATSGQNEQLIKRFEKSGIPVVLFDRMQPTLKGNYILEKHEQCIVTMTEYLIENNHKNIAYIKGPKSSYVSEFRFGKFKEILKKNSIDLLSDFYFDNCYSEEVCDQAFDKICSNLNKITAVMLTNANQIKYLIKYGNKNGIKLPQELSFLGFGLEEYKTLFAYPITCIVQNHYDIARNVADKILELIDCEKNKQKKEYETILVESEFFKGKSVIKL